MYLIFLLLAAHICGDILINPAFLAKAKRSTRLSTRLQALVSHCLLHVVLAWLWLWNYPLAFKAWAGGYIFVVHFVIDYARIFVEMSFVDRDGPTIVKRGQAVRYLLGRADKETNLFMAKYFKRWGLLTLGDQGLHVVAIGGFAVASSMLL